ncbi:MAG: trypsin-like serine protease [Geminicoccaceae bacterium]|nr:trypsin-like serine protease [Geminicoccaceae bacterium]
MRFVLILFGLFCAAPAGAVAPGQPGIVGRDDRRPIALDEQRPWNAVGRLNREAGGFCTAVLVGPREALTAAHCLWDHVRGRWLEPETIHFVPGYRRGAYLGHARGASFRFAPSIVMTPEGRPSELVDDWAVVLLDLDLQGGAGIEPLAVAGATLRRALGPSATLMRAGYGSDRPHLPILVDHCSVLGSSGEGRLLLHDCDATLGDSGSPIVVRHEGRLMVLGIQSSVVRLGDDEAGVAVVVEKQLPAAALLGH